MNMSKLYKVSRDEEEVLITNLSKRTDAEASRIKRYLEMDDLSRTVGSPLFDMVSRVKQVPSLKNFDEIDIPEIISTEILFDLFDFAPNHPARSKSDTYYVDETHVLRTHDTVMWHYYLNLPEIKERVKKNEPLGVICYGKVYRKDEIDRKHMNIFHQMGGLYLVPDNQQKLELDDLKNVLSEIVESTFGADVKYRFLDDTFPYTDPSLQIEVLKSTSTSEGVAEPTEASAWIEIMGGGMPKKSVLEKMGITGYNGWAFGFGLERLAIISMELPDIRLLWSQDPRVKKQLELGKKFTEVSKFPPVIRDISFVVNNSPTQEFIPNNYFDLVRDIAPNMVEQVELLDKYEDEKKFGKDNISYAFRVVYRSLERTLTNEEVDKLHKSLEESTTKNFGATVR